MNMKKHKKYLSKKICSIPTEYNGIQFRSRLEAKWATFFDLLNWSWEYEPVDFSGWIPDFLITSSDKRLFIEVKPFFKEEETNQDILNTWHKICKRTNDAICLCGVSPIYTYPYLSSYGKGRPIALGYGRDRVTNELIQMIVDARKIFRMSLNFYIV